MYYKKPTQLGNVLILILILLIVIGLLSISLFSSSLQSNKNSIEFEKISLAFYKTEACLLQTRYYFYHLNQPIPVKANCRNKNCANKYDYTLDLPSKNSAWWKKHGISCTQNIWQYRELITKKLKYHEIYRISVYNTQHILLQLYIDKNFSLPDKILYSWRRIY